MATEVRFVVKSAGLGDGKTVSISVSEDRTVADVKLALRGVLPGEPEPSQITLLDLSASHTLHAVVKSPAPPPSPRSSASASTASASTTPGGASSSGQPGGGASSAAGRRTPGAAAADREAAGAAPSPTARPPTPESLPGTALPSAVLQLYGEAVRQAYLAAFDALARAEAGGAGGARAEAAATPAARPPSAVTAAEHREGGDSPRVSAGAEGVTGGTAGGGDDEASVGPSGSPTAAQPAQVPTSDPGSSGSPRSPGMPEEPAPRPREAPEEPTRRTNEAPTATGGPSPLTPGTAHPGPPPSLPGGDAARVAELTVPLVPTFVPNPMPDGRPRPDDYLLIPVAPPISGSLPPSRQGHRAGEMGGGGGPFGLGRGALGGPFQPGIRLRRRRPAGAPGGGLVAGAYAGARDAVRALLGRGERPAAPVGDGEPGAGGGPAHAPAPQVMNAGGWPGAAAPPPGGVGRPAGGLRPGGVLGRIAQVRDPRALLQAFVLAVMVYQHCPPERLLAVGLIAAFLLIAARRPHLQRMALRARARGAGPRGVGADGAVEGGPGAAGAPPPAPAEAGPGGAEAARPAAAPAEADPGGAEAARPAAPPAEPDRVVAAAAAAAPRPAAGDPVPAAPVAPGDAPGPAPDAAAVAAAAARPNRAHGALQEARAIAVGFFSSLLPGWHEDRAVAGAG